MLENHTLSDFKEHAKREFPKECCGVVVDVNGVTQYRPCENISDGNMFFIINPIDYAEAESIGLITHIAHSHPNSVKAIASKADIHSCNNGDIEWVIINGDCTDLVYIQPEKSNRNYIGREYISGVFDCATLISDYYEKEFSIKLSYPPYTRIDWWEEEGDRFINQLILNGFNKIEESDVKSGDIIAIQIRASFANHGAIYLGDNIILHHCHNRPSGKDIYDGFWRKHTRSFWRHHANN